MHYPIMEFATIDSTNSEAKRLAERGERGPLWIRADRQEIGRGRCARTWSSPAGNLFATFLFSPSCAVEYLQQLALVTGVAACDTIRMFIGDAKPESLCRLKWPNDLMIGKAKTGGILVESTIIGRDRLAILGCGINIAVKPAINGREVAAISEHGAAPEPHAFLEQLDHNLHNSLNLWQNGAGFMAIRQAWMQRSFPLGTEISINTNDGLIVGVFGGLAEDGALILKQKTGEHLRFNFGDVVIGGYAENIENEDNDKN